AGRGPCLAIEAPLHQLPGWVRPGPDILGCPPILSLLPKEVRTASRPMNQARRLVGSLPPRPVRREPAGRPVRETDAPKRVRGSPKAGGSGRLGATNGPTVRPRGERVRTGGDGNRVGGRGVSSSTPEATRSGENKLGLVKGQVVQEIGWDDDVDED